MGNERKVNNDADDSVDDEIYQCLNPSKPQSFFLFAGAGSGKTRSLVNVLERFKDEFGKYFGLYRHRIGIITYTNAAAAEITRRLKYDSIFQVSTIHSFSWELIKHFTNDIRNSLREDLGADILKLEEAQSKSRDLANKTSIDRARKIESKKNRLQNLNSIIKFTYNPNGDNLSKDSLNHAEVISITASFIKNKNLMQDIVVSLFPIILVDESQDTKKEMVDALFELQLKKKDRFSLGLFGDMMQRIYGDGKENLDKNLPDDWARPAKRMNHRSNNRIIRLINDIRKNVDGQEQVPRTEKEDGHVRLFISDRNVDKRKIERFVSEKMSTLSNDLLWDLDTGVVKTLILEHHMAASRMGFLELFEPLYKTEKLKTSLLEGKLSSLNLFTKIVLPLVEAYRTGDKFSMTRVAKEHSRLLSKDVLMSSTEQMKNLQEANLAVKKLLELWENDNDPKLIEILERINKSSLFEIPSPLNTIVSRSVSETSKAITEDHEENDEIDDVVEAWDNALQTSFSQVEKYNNYFSENSQFGTHQGVKGLEYQRVMVILDDEEARGFLFSYDKLFGVKGFSKTDEDNIRDGKETSLDRTRRLFYVACSRAEHSLAIVAYTSNPEAVKNTVLENGWFKAKEVEIIDAKQ